MTKRRATNPEEEATILAPAVTAYLDRIRAEGTKRIALASAGRRGKRRPSPPARPSPAAVSAVAASTISARPVVTASVQEPPMKPSPKKPRLSTAAFLRSVKNHATGAGPIDPIFANSQSAPGSAVTTSGTGTDGGYLAPPEFRAVLTDAMLAETSLLGLTDKYVIAASSLTLAADAAPSWVGATPAQDPEAAALKVGKGLFQSRSARPVKLDLLAPVSSELLEDSGPALEGYLRQVVIDRLLFQATNLLLNGAPEVGGILNAGALVVVSKESGQTAGTVVFNNVSKMWQRMWSPSKSRAVWLCHSDVEAQLQQMVSPVGSPALTYTAGEPFPRLFGRPVLVTEAAQVLGAQGDIVLVDPKSLLTVVRGGEQRDENGVKVDFSAHVFFDIGAGAFRFTMRAGMTPWWAAPVTRLRGGPTISTLVTLEPR